MAYTIEISVATWISPDWCNAHKHKDWERMCTQLYGAVQASLWSDDEEGYDVYKTLLVIAREHRLNAVHGMYKEEQ